MLVDQTKLAMATDSVVQSMAPESAMERLILLPFIHKFAPSESHVTDRCGWSGGAGLACHGSRERRCSAHCAVHSCGVPGLSAGRINHGHTYSAVPKMNTGSCAACVEAKLAPPGALQRSQGESPFTPVDTGRRDHTHAWSRCKTRACIDPSVRYREVASNMRL